jgi:NADPH:quinone reductase
LTFVPGQEVADVVEAAGEGAGVQPGDSPANHDYLRLGASAVFGHHAADWVQQVRGAVSRRCRTATGLRRGQTRDQAIGAIRDDGRERLEALSRLVDAGTLRPQIEAVLPLDQARETLTWVAGRHTRGKVVLRIGQE